MKNKEKILFLDRPSPALGWPGIKLGIILSLCLFLFMHPFCVQAQIISTVVGHGGSFGYSGDGGPANESDLFEPLDIVFDADGNYYIADYRNYIIRKVDLNGTITTIAGTPQTPGDVLNTCIDTNATMGGPTGIAIDNAGNIYIADYSNQVVRKVNIYTNLMTIVAGNGAPGYQGDSAAATQAELNFPAAVAVDAYGNLYISDNGNNVIRKVDTSGMIKTFAGSSTTVAGYQTGIAGYGGDGGPPTAATLYSPMGLFLDGVGNLYIADAGNNVVRMVQAGYGGVITTVAGNGTGGYMGDGGAAIDGELSAPENMAIDDQGNLFISEAGNNIIRRVSTSGILSTVAGNVDSVGYSGDGGPATGASLNAPFGIAFDAFGDLYIADKLNSIVRKISGEGTVGVAQVKASNTPVLLFPNPNDGFCTVSGTLKSGVDENVSLEVTDMLGRIVYANEIIAHNGIIYTHIADPGISAGLYLLHVQSETENNISKFSVSK